MHPKPFNKTCCLLRRNTSDLKHFPLELKRPFKVSSDLGENYVRMSFNWNMKRSVWWGWWGDMHTLARRW